MIKGEFAAKLLGNEKLSNLFALLPKPGVQGIIPGTLLQQTGKISLINDVHAF